MRRYRWLCVLALTTAHAAHCQEAAETGSWQRDPLIRTLAARLDSVRCIDNHTHLLDTGYFDSTINQTVPLLLRSSNPENKRVLRERFHTEFSVDWKTTIAKATEMRAQMVKRAGGQHEYWLDHLDYVGCESALINQRDQAGTDGQRLRWVPYATFLIYPVRADALMARSPRHNEDIKAIQEVFAQILKEQEVAIPPDLDTYVRFVDETLARWQKGGAVAVKFNDAYRRPLRFDEVPEARARSLYTQGVREPLALDDYLALQDYLVRHILLTCGKMKLPVHIHSGPGAPPFMRLGDSDVRNLESVLTDARFFNTQIVLIHAYGPIPSDAAYLTAKPNVWIDVSSKAFLLPVPDLAAELRVYLLSAPGKVLFGTDAAGYPWVPLGPEVQHAALVRDLREALYVALAGLIRDEVIDLDQAVEIGKDFLRGNAERLYGWSPKPH